MSEQYLLKLYVTGNTLRSQRAIANLNRFCEQELPGQHTITIIDVLKTPKVAEEEKILITPTLVKEQPLPCERIIGDLSDTEVILFALNIPSKSQAQGS
ncbi:MAG: circadian clock KaiB family protein [Cyanophyceae cyanobacterium]